MSIVPAGGPLAAASFLAVEPTLFVSTLVLFLLFAWVLAKFGWGPLLKIIEQREKTVREGVEGAQKAREEAEALLEQHRELLRAAGREREDLVKRALAEADQIKADLVARGKAESDTLVQRAREAIEMEKTKVAGELRAELGELVVEATARILKSSLTPEAQKKLVDDFIAALPDAH
jgi:F-type H+-transporting ATPase subunit b